MQQILDAAFRDPLNQAFSLAILALAGAAVVGAFVRSGPLARLAQPAPGLLTALGVLGTFVGILLGLLGFDATDIPRIEGRRVFLYIREFQVSAETLEEACRAPEKLRRFHVAWCQTLREMRSAGRFERYVASERVDEPFGVALRASQGE